MRTPKPYKRTRDGLWYLQLGKKQINLGRDEQQALQKYHSIMAGLQEPEPDIKLVDLFDRFLDWVQANRAPKSYKWYKVYLQSFKDCIGNARAMDVKPYHVDRWLSGKTDGNRNSGVRVIKRAFKWAADSGYIPRSPVSAVKRPTLHPRECYLSPEQWRQFISLVQPGPFHDAVMFLRLTGCRPDELYKIEARHIDGGCIVLDRPQSKGQRDRRVIPLTQKALAIVDRLAKQNADGVLFRTVSGRRWTNHSFNTRFDHFEKKLPFKIFPYMLRHSFITDALVKGLDPIKLASIVGHKDLTMIQKVYAHLELKRDHLRNELERISEDGGTPTAA